MGGLSVSLPPLPGWYRVRISPQPALGMAPGDLLTVAFVLPSGRPCKLRAVVVHCQRHGCGVQFREGHTQSLATLAHYWASLGEKA